MSKTLEILGRAMAIDTADLMVHWLDTVTFYEAAEQYDQLKGITKLLTEGQIDAAGEQLRLYLFENPSCMRGRLAAAAICLHRNRITSAVEELNFVYLRQPNNTMALYVLGHCHERLGNESEAVKFYQDCLKFKKFLQLPRQRLAAIYLKNGQIEKTITEYELLRAEYPDDIASLVMLGHLYITAGQYSKAVETFNTAILIRPDSLADGDDDIDRLIQSGRLDEAIEQLDEVLAQWPQRADLITKRADILTMLGATNQALNHYEQALRICPDCLETTIKMATQYLQADQFQLAAQQFNRATEINDRIVDAYIGLTVAQQLAGEISSALTTLSLASAISANTPLLFAQTAALQLKSDQASARLYAISTEDDSSELLVDVIKAHQQQIEQRPQNPDLYYRLGILMMSVNDVPSAIKAFERTLEINPAYTRARSKLAVCLYETGRDKYALEQLHGPENIDSLTLELYYKTALLYCDKIKFASSLINLYNSIESNFTHSDPAVNISIVLQNLGLLDRAATMWDNLLETAQHANDNSRPS